ncbi:FN3 domain-containing metallophosphoesterase family protein [Anatilimnocola floriformis]|uniref:FN3 domain-containing metallophosphoesterase family protein n=1 Tax=Anatilimnocola floriformis TaxID=2948575 RepID=UPI0020C46C64|nr:FN3 domain-containing metallophosphoesterase family protein [Anatilimnocola floriformis]
MDDVLNSATRRDFLVGTAAATLTPLLVSETAAQTTDAPADAKLYIQPYLQNPTADAMTICFAALAADDVRVRWGKDKTALTETARLTSSAIPKVTWRVWKARLEKLNAAQTYYYRVDYRENGEERSSEIYTFTPFDPQGKEVRAVIYNDVHDRIATAEALVKLVKPSDFEFSILLGDMWNDPSVANNARQALVNLEAYVRLFDGSNKPMLFIRGNHDVRGSFAGQLSHLVDFPGSDPAAPFAEQKAYFDFLLGPCWFIAPDSGEDGSKKMELFQPYRQQQTEWLTGLFANSSERSATWRILLTHIPLYYRGFWDAAHSRDLWEPVLRGAKIDLCISGHIHKYDLIAKDKEIVHVVDKTKPDETTIRHTPPFATVIGGGPSLPEATVTFFTASEKQLRVRALDAQGREVVKFEQER